MVAESEIKTRGFDPFFCFNHRCAVVRDHLVRLFERTWRTITSIDEIFTCHIDEAQVAYNVPMRDLLR